MIRYDVRGCTMCDSCRWVCPAGAISFDLSGAHIDQSKCNACGTCRDNCASEAIIPSEFITNSQNSKITGDCND